jgi:solute carrier family 30 (zinc transporter), member 1
MRRDEQDLLLESYAGDLACVCLLSVFPSFVFVFFAPLRPFFFDSFRAVVVLVVLLGRALIRRRWRVPRVPLSPRVSSPPPRRRSFCSQTTLRSSLQAPKTKWDVKLVAFVLVGIITLLYVCFELGVALFTHSLVLMSDGFHNLSDVISLGIAFWAQQAQKKPLSHDYTFGWGRAEILGGLTNACFLLSLCLYVVLESIPKFVQPEPLVKDAGGTNAILFIIVAAAGLGVNTFGTVIFHFTGQGHTHSHGGGGHSHGGGGGHSHGGDSGHAHGSDKKKKKKKSGHGHSHGGHDSGHSHGGHDSGHSHGGDSGHSHGSDKSKKKKSGHGHSHGVEDLGEEKAKRDMNVHAVFLHYLGDMVSSAIVLVAGLLIYFLGEQYWTYYIDAISSLIIVVLILWTTVPLVKQCSIILLQSVPDSMDLGEIREEMLDVEGLVSVHDLHVWQLVDGMVITSVHVGVEEGSDFTQVVNDVKRVLHDHGIHSSSIQPEFVARHNADAPHCEQNCVDECEEDWCCKKSVETRQRILEEYSVRNEF